ncbi:cysteine hydrolase family protein [Rodentibacter pneumotropicus]|uniref:cysteine hydrolase family protein n=1 Tax=Rodentibacter pneumotropicus TaxID=758 RepID=UPI0009860F64|nr:cysteine hydrolase family protein [Rodentibacter pneumotropicus]OOF60754.1 cysteine hydrolase [Rodentibacter pneumotropicus]THA16799.1 cysteine hydrolase [Rodentibacter pneumotropicus]
MLADALLIIDFQNGVCFGEKQIYNYDNVVKLINQRIDNYAYQNKPIIFVQHTDEFLTKNSDGWKIVSDLHTDKGKFFIEKSDSSAFYQTELDSLLKRENITSLEICGAETPFCVEATVQAAHNLGYKLYMKKGATTTNFQRYMTAENTIKHYEDIWGFNNYFLTLLDE